MRVSLREGKYARTRVELMQEQERKSVREQAILGDWAAKFDKAISAIQKLGPHWMLANASQTNAYGLAFPGPDLVPRIESYLIEEKLSRGPVRTRSINAT